ncbi:MAG: flagellar biosynthetic protein FliR [Anaerolineales bacterium]|nr:flagellar biosynthetic protein FliR [Anaerolineales bacterium]
MIVSVAQAQVFFLALTRVMAMIVHVPVLGGSGIPNRIKIGFGVLLAMVILTWDPLPASREALSLVALAVQIARELLIGTLAGFGAVLTFGAIQMAGDVMGMGSGFRAAQMLNPALGLQGSSMNQFFVVVATLVFLAVDGHHLFLIAIQRTFDMLPLATALPVFSSERLLATTGQLIGAGVQIALPVFGAVLLTDLSLGLLARVAPQIQVFFLGVPVKLGIGIAALLFSLGVLFPLLRDLFSSIGDHTLMLLGGL